MKIGVPGGSVPVAVDPLVQVRLTAAVPVMVHPISVVPTPVKIESVDLS